MARKRSGRPFLRMLWGLPVQLRRFAKGRSPAAMQAQKREAERLAKHFPNVQQVVNEIEVKPGKHSTAS
jgi:hypothetical protein